jgi:hypothetical protein
MGWVFPLLYWASLVLAIFAWSGVFFWAAWEAWRSPRRTWFRYPTTALAVVGAALLVWLLLHPPWPRRDLTGIPIGPGVDLSGRKLSYAKLQGADLSGANLQGTEFWGADLTRAKLRGADLRGADLRETVVSGADFSRADLRGARLYGGGVWQEVNLSGARYDRHTKWHPGFDPRQHGAVLSKP